MLYLRNSTILEWGNRSKITKTVEEIIGRKPTSFAQFIRDYANVSTESCCMAIQTSLTTLDLS